MKIERRGTEVEIKRNKRKGLKLMIRYCSLNYNSCKYCYLNSRSVCSLSMSSPCEEVGLLADEYFIHKK